MRRSIIVLPNLLGATPDDSPLRQTLPALTTLTELGEVKRLNKLPEIETPEALWLGMKPDEGQLRQGPLTVSALGADPPERSTHFHVSLLGYQDGKAIDIPFQIPEPELRQILEQAKKLNTKKLTFVSGENTDHGLVWEDLGDLHTTPADKVTGNTLKAYLPEGDAERELRRFIDDSINLLSELELNERRQDEDLPPLNLFWPWGHGVRLPVPNLLRKRGEPVVVESNSLRLQGLTRLTGYKHGDRHAFGQGTNTRLERLAGIALSNDLTIIVISAPGEFRKAGRLEELHWLVREMNDRLIRPLLDNALKNPARITVMATGPAGGLAASFETGMDAANVYPFDERSLEEKLIAKSDAWTEIEAALHPVPRGSRKNPA